MLKMTIKKKLLEYIKEERKAIKKELPNPWDRIRIGCLRELLNLETFIKYT